MPLASFIEKQVVGPDGKPYKGIVVNPVKQYVRGYWLVDSDNVAVVLAGNGRAELHFLVDQQGHFDWAYIIGQSTGAFTLEFFDPGTQRRLQNRPVHSTTIVGSGVRPFRLPEPYFFNVGESQRQIICTVRDLTGTSNTVRLVLYGRRFYHREAPPDIAQHIARTFGSGQRTFSYFLVPNETNGDGTVTAVAANGTTTFTLESDDNADTELQKLLASSTGAFTFQIRERSTNRTLQNGVVHSNNGFGNAEFPFLFADTYLLERKMQLLVEVTDISGAENSIFITAAARRLQYRG